METLLLYVLKSAAVLGLFYTAYQLLLKKETFFNANRVFLLMGLISATLLPLAVFTKTVWVDPQPQQQLSNADMALLMAAMQNQPAAQPDFQLNWLFIVLGIYAAGLLFFGIKLLADIYKVRRMLKGKNLVQDEGYKLVDSHDIEAPFSFFNYIVFNSAALQPQELESIISHEKVHSRQKHSLDMLVAQAYCILFWFNPLAWLYRKAISQNLEFIADAEAAVQVTDRTSYQKTMLRLSVQPQQIAIINHFYQSLIKKRIVMLNKQRSHRRNSWKFAVVLPLLAAFMMAFQVKTVAREKTDTKTITATPYGNDVQMLEITKDTDAEALKRIPSLFKEISGAEASFTNVTRNEKGEITGIRIEVKANDINRLYDVDGTEPISTIHIKVEKDGDTVKNIEITTGKVVNGEYTDTSGGTIIKGDTVITKKVRVIAAPLEPLEPLAPLAPPAKIAYGSNNGQNVAMNISNNTVVLINGKKQEKGAPVNIPQGQQISSVNVIKSKDAKKKYGKEAKDGAIEITTTKAANSHAMVVSPSKSFVYNLNSDEGPYIAEGTFNWSTDEMPDFEFEMNADDTNGAMRMLVLKKQMEEFSNMTKDAWKDFEGDDAALAERIKKVKEEVQKVKEKHYLIIKDREQSAADKEQANGDKADANAWKLEFFGQKIRMEMEKNRQEMEKARKEMERVRKQMDAERDKYKAERAKATRKA
jgi:BlaR1 peptidase M56